MNASLFERIIKTTLIGILCLDWLGGQGFGMSPASFVQMTQRVRLNHDLVLKNSPRVYFDLGLALDHDRVFGSTGDYYVFTLASVVNEKADNRNISFTLHKGTTVAEAVRHIAKVRNERVIDDRANYLLIVPAEMAPMLKSYQIGEIAPSGPENANKSIRYQMVSVLDCLLPRSSIHLERCNGYITAEFLDAMLAETMAMTGGKEKITIKMEDPISQQIEKTYVMGRWSYKEVFNVYCFLGNFRWKAEGGTIWFVEPPRDAKAPASK